MIKKFWIIFIYLLFINYQSFAETLGSDTNLKIPRFVSIKSNEANLRIGSSKNYSIILKYTSKNMPVKIIEEHKNWRKIIDIKGNQGWLHKSLIKGERFAIINDNQYSLKIFNKPSGKNIGEIGKFNVVQLKTCLLEWCKISYVNKKGWVLKKNLWGVFKNEKINIPFYQFVINLLWKINF